MRFPTDFVKNRQITGQSIQAYRMLRQKSAAGTHLCYLKSTGQKIWFPARRCRCPDLRPAGPFGVPLRRFAAFDPGHPLACRQAPPRVRGSRLGILSTVVGCAALAPMPPLAAPPHAARACPSVLAPRPPLGCAARRSRGARPAAPWRQAGLRVPTDPPWTAGGGKIQGVILAVRGRERAFGRQRYRNPEPP